MTVSNKKQLYINHLHARMHEAPRHCALSEAEIDNVAGLLLDGTVFGIMGELRDIQEITENKQLKKRTAKQLDHKNQLKGLVDAQHKMLHMPTPRSPLATNQMLTKFDQDKMDLERKLQDELKSIDLETLAVMDGQVKDQQEYLMLAIELECMKITQDKHTIEKQMYLLETLHTLKDL